MLSQRSSLPVGSFAGSTRMAKYWFSIPAKSSGNVVLSIGFVAEATSLAACEIGLVSFPWSWPKTTSRNVPVYHSPSMGMPCGPSRL